MQNLAAHKFNTHRLDYSLRNIHSDKKRRSFSNWYQTDWPTDRRIHSNNAHQRSNQSQTSVGRHFVKKGTMGAIVVGQPVTQLLYISTRLNNGNGVPTRFPSKCPLQCGTNWKVPDGTVTYLQCSRLSARGRGASAADGRQGIIIVHVRIVFHLTYYSDP